MTESHSNKKFCHFVIYLCRAMTKYTHNLLAMKPITFLARITGFALSNAIKKSLCTYDIDISITRGLAYDGAASAMSSNISRVLARIREAAPLELYTHIAKAMFHCSYSSST